MLTQVSCQSCKMAVNVTPNFCRNAEEVRLCGAKVHKDSKLICPKPMLILIYVNMMISNDMLKQPVQPLIRTPNGEPAQSAEPAGG
jgi:hypothetical protein